MHTLLDSAEAKLPGNTIESGLKRSWLIFILLWAIGAFLFFLRVPEYITHPNFFGEDADFTFHYLASPWIFLKSRQNGWWMVGTTLMLHLSHRLNYLIFNSDILKISVCYALVSYCFWGFVASFPVILLRKFLSLHLLIVLWSLTVSTPLNFLETSYIGTLCNLKFLFVYLGVIFFLHRILTPINSPIQIATAGCLVFCAYCCPLGFATNFMALIFDRFNIKRPSNLVLCLGFIPQIALLSIKGIPENPWHIAMPPINISAILVFVVRTFQTLPLLVFQEYFSTFEIIILTSILIVLCFRLCSKESKVYVSKLFMMAMVFSLFSLWQRPQLLICGGNFASANCGSQYLLISNQIVSLAMLFALQTFCNRKRRWKLVSGFMLIYAGFAIGTANKTGIFRRKFNFEIEPITDSLPKICKNLNGKSNLPDFAIGNAYPKPNKFILPTKLACPKLEHS